MNKKQWSAFIALSCIWGTSFLWIKIAVQEVSPLIVVTLRLFIAVLTLSVFLVSRKPGVPRGRRLWGVLLLQGLLFTAIPWSLIMWAEKYIDSAEATVFNATVPLFTVIFAHIFLKDDRITARRILGLSLGFVGVIALVQEKLAAHWGAPQGMVNLALVGQGAMLLSSAFYGVAHVYARAKLSGIPPIVQAFYTMLLADSVMWFVTPVIEPPFTLPVRALTWVAIAWLGVLGAGVSHMIFYHLLHSIGPTRVGMVTYLVPAVGVTLGAVFLKEKLSWSLVLGTILIILGIWQVNRQ
jgi:drug/metabolite transporter (DMT)-like permease